MLERSRLRKVFQEPSFGLIHLQVLEALIDAKKHRQTHTYETLASLLAENEFFNHLSTSFEKESKPTALSIVLHEKNTKNLTAAKANERRKYFTGLLASQKALCQVLAPLKRAFLVAETKARPGHRQINPLPKETAFYERQPKANALENNSVSLPLVINHLTLASEICKIRRAMQGSG